MVYIYIYPKDLFYPIDTITFHLHITKNSRTIYHYAATWVNGRLKKKVKIHLQHMIPDLILILWHEKYT